MFGSTRIHEPERAAEDLRRAEQALTENPAEPSLHRAVKLAEKIKTKSVCYELAKEYGRLVNEETLASGPPNPVIVTGSGIMGAANRGAHDAGGKSIGLNIIIPRERCSNRFVTPELCFQFQYFALRKMHCGLWPWSCFQVGTALWINCLRHLH